MKRIIVGGLACVAALAIGWFVLKGSRTPADRGPSANTENVSPPSQKLLDLPEGLAESDYRAAEQLFRVRFPQREVGRLETLLMAGDLAASEHKLEVALACYRAIPTDAAEIGLAARLQEGLLLVENNRAAEAESALQAYLATARVAKRLSPRDVISAFKWLTFILSVEIRLEERKPLLQEMHAIELADPLDSKQLYFPQLLILNSPAGRSRLELFLQNDPKNVRLRLAQARYKTLEGQFDKAMELLQPLRDQYPADKGIAAALLEAFFESGQTEKMTAILEALPAFDEFEPWLLTRMRGEAAFLDKDYVSAEKYFQAGLQKDATYAQCQIGLSRVYAAQGSTDQQQQALKRSAILADIRVNLTKVQPDAAAAATELAAKCQELGLTEANQAFEKHAQNIMRSQASTPQTK